MSNSVFSPDGRNFQVEYAGKAVENAGTSLGIKCKDGVVFAFEKIITSKLLVPGKNRKILSVDKHIGLIASGLIPDSRHLANRAREESKNYRSFYKSPISIPYLVDRIGNYVQAHTCYNSVRPFGIMSIIGGVDEDGPHLYMIEPSGVYWGYLGAAAGKGRQIAKSELEKLDLPNISCRDALKEAARIIYLAHEDQKDKDFELEMSWISKSETNSVHQFVPEELLKQVKLLAEESDEEEDDEEDEEMQEN